MSLRRHILGSRAKRISSHEINPEDVFLDSTNLSDMNIHQMEGHLEKPLPSIIGLIFLGLLFLSFSGFSFKLFSMQIVDGDVYKEKADRNHLKSTPIFAHRGTVSDINGELLAWNESIDSNQEIPRRKYIDKPGFSNILGYVSYPKKDSSGIFWQDEYIGRDGIEKQYQEKLQGVSGEKVIAVDALHKIEAENVTVEPKQGENLRLTIDAKVQNKLYESIKSLAVRAPFSAGSGVIIDVHNGDVLAMVSYPEYDNNLMTNPETKDDNDRIKSDLTDKSFKFLNRPISGLFTPGSIVKPFIAIAALMEDIILPEKNILSTGQIVIKNKYGGPDTVFKDWKAHGYVDMRKAIAVSSDEYFYQVGGGYQEQKGLGIDRIDKYVKLFGFSTGTGIDLPNEKSGIIPTPEWKKKLFNEDWLLGDTYHTAIGQYGFQITPIEMARAYSAIANGGNLITPHLLFGQEIESVSLNLLPDDLKVIREGMRQGAIDGTGRVLNIEGVKVATKSGTAELGISKKLVNSSIAGFFPYENPRYAFIVIMEKGNRANMQGAVFAMRETLEWMRDNTGYTK